MYDLEHRPGIALIDNHDAVRESLAILLEDEGLHVCVQASGRTEALARITSEKPDVAIVDLSLDGESGLRLVEDLQGLGVPCVVCSSHEEPEYVRRALAAGARAYVTKREAGRALAHAIREALEGWILVSPQAADLRTDV